MNVFALISNIVGYSVALATIMLINRQVTRFLDLKDMESKVNRSAELDSIKKKLADLSVKIGLKP